MIKGTIQLEDQTVAEETGRYIVMAMLTTDEEGQKFKFFTFGKINPSELLQLAEAIHDSVLETAKTNFPELIPVIELMQHRVL